MLLYFPHAYICSIVQFFQSQGTASSAFGFLPDIGHQFLHPPKHSQAAFHSIVNSTDAFGRVTNPMQGTSSTFKEPTHQVCPMPYCAYISHFKLFKTNSRQMELNSNRQYLLVPRRT
jgi:hypothetical protein